MDMLTYQTAKCSLMSGINAIHLRLNNFKNDAYVRLVRQVAFIYTYFVCVKLGDFLSKKCKLYFLFSIDF